MSIKYRLHVRTYDYSDFDTREKAEKEMSRINTLNNLDTVPDWYYVATHIEIVEVPDEISIEKEIDMSKSDREYRDSMDSVMEELGAVLVDLGAVTADGVETDAEIVTIATRKIKTLHSMLETLMHPSLLAAVMKN